MTAPACPICGRPLHPATASVCVHCRHTIDVAVANISAYHADLAILRIGQTRYNDSNGATRRRGEGHLGMDTRFDARAPGTRLLHETRTVIVGWTRYVLGHVSLAEGPVCDVACLHRSCIGIRKAAPPVVTNPDPLRPAADATVASCCRFLARWTEWLRVSPGGQDALNELTDLERRLARLVDRPPDRWYAGTCSARLDGDRLCTHELYAKAERADIRCRSCGTTHDVAGRRAIMLAAAENVVLTATEAARAITLLGEYSGTSNQLADRIYKWSTRGRISQADKSVQEVDGRPQVVYRLGAVLDLLVEDLHRAGKVKATA